METPYSALFVPQKDGGESWSRSKWRTGAREVISQLAVKKKWNRRFRRPADRTGVVGGTEAGRPAGVASRALVEYDPAEDVYIVPFLNTTVLCYPATEQIVVLERLADLSGDFQLNVVVLHYLLHSLSKPVANKWVSGKDLPSGGFFLRQPTRFRPRLA